MREDSITKNERGDKRKNVTIDESNGIKLTAEAVAALAKGVTEMRRHAKDKLIVLMIHDATGVSKRDIQTILNVIPELERIYLVKK